jgi:hypothetical protein
MIDGQAAFEEMRSQTPRKDVMSLYLLFGASVISGIGPTEIE